MRSLTPHDPEVDELEQAFYAAWRSGDLERLMACWADDEEVVCIHPGGVRLVGLRAVRESFRELLGEGVYACMSSRCNATAAPVAACTAWSSGWSS